MRGRRRDGGNAFANASATCEEAEEVSDVNANRNPRRLRRRPAPNSPGIG